MPVNTSEANLEAIIERSLTGIPGGLGEPAPPYSANGYTPGGYLQRTFAFTATPKQKTSRILRNCEQ